MTALLETFRRGNPDGPDYKRVVEMLNLVADEPGGVLLIPMWKEPKLRDFLEDLTLLTVYGFLEIHIEAEAAADRQYFQYKLTPTARAVFAIEPATLN